MLLCAALVPARLLAEPASVFYAYDVLNRLIAVVDQDGNAATYTYDAVGNIVRIERFETSGAPGVVAISMFAPPAGVIGTPVEVFGRGFGPTPAQNTLSFGGRASEILAAAPNRLVARVPTGATSGPISVTAPAGAATSSRAFHVLGQFAVSPPGATVRVSGQAMFGATESGSPVTARWAVNDLPGGDARVGTITIDGLYTAPAAIPLPSIVMISATHHDDPTLRAFAAVTIVPPLGVLVWSRPVGIAGATPPLLFDRSLATAISIAPEAPRSAILAASVAVSAELEPVILGMTPSSGVAGGAPFTLRIVGRGLTGATAVSLLRSNTADPAVVVSNVSVNADGSEATADVDIAATAPAGTRVVQISTPGRVSTPAGTGGNVFTLL